MLRAVLFVLQISSKHFFFFKRLCEFVFVRACVCFIIYLFVVLLFFVYPAAYFSFPSDTYEKVALRAKNTEYTGCGRLSL